MTADYAPELVPARDEDAPPPDRWTPDWERSHPKKMRSGYDHEAELQRLRDQIDADTADVFSRYTQAELADILGEHHGAAAKNLDNDARHLVDGATFVLDGDSTIKPRWGAGDSVLWPEGEALMICAPPGVGKTTLALQLVDAAIGIGPADLLGLPVTRARRILYLAMDRPKQIRRAMLRLWGEDQRDALADRLRVWYGPLPFDVAERASGLVEMAEQVDADVIVIDSLKDAAVQLTDDRTAGMVNRAIQTALANNVDVLTLHHQRKGQNGEKPKRLEDVYGSTWLTAGMGSVVLLWGAAGDPLVELAHLKQPAGEVGPWRVDNDHNAGRSSIYSGFDLDRYLDLNPTGVTTMAVARAMTEKATPSDNERKKAQRLLDAAAKRGYLTKTDAVKGGQGGATGALYTRSELRLAETS